MRDFIKAMDAAYDRGVDDAKKGIDKCPFDINEPEAHQWQCGYNDVSKDKVNELVKKSEDVSKKLKNLKKAYVE